MSEQHNAVMRRFIHEAWDLRNSDICDELLAADFQHFMPGSAQPTVGPDAYKQLIAAFFTAFPEGRLRLGEVFSEGDHICALWTFTGIHKATFNSIEPAGHQVVLPGVAVGQMRGTQISVVHSLFDSAVLMNQLKGTES